MAQYFNIFKDVGRGFEHQTHQQKYHDEDFRKKGWKKQHTLASLGRSFASFGEGLMGGEGLVAQDVAEERELTKAGVRPYQAPTSNQSNTGSHMTQQNHWG